MTDEIRGARASDWPGIEALLKAAGLPLDGAHDIADGFVVAIRQGTVVASAALERYGTMALLRSVAVRPEMRGDGLGRALVERILEIVRADGLEQVALLTTTAANYFPRFGCRRARR